MAGRGSFLDPAGLTIRACDPKLCSTGGNAGESHLIYPQSIHRSSPYSYSANKCILNKYIVVGSGTTGESSYVLPGFWSIHICSGLSCIRCALHVVSILAKRRTQTGFRAGVPLRVSRSPLFKPTERRWRLEPPRQVPSPEAGFPSYGGWAVEQVEAQAHVSQHGHWGYRGHGFLYFRSTFALF